MCTATGRKRRPGAQHPLERLDVVKGGAAGAQDVEVAVHRLVVLHAPRARQQPLEHGGLAVEAAQVAGHHRRLQRLPAQRTGRPSRGPAKGKGRVQRVRGRGGRSLLPSAAAARSATPNAAAAAVLLPQVRRAAGRAAHLEVCASSLRRLTPAPRTAPPRVLRESSDLARSQHCPRSTSLRETGAWAQGVRVGVGRWLCRAAASSSSKPQRTASRTREPLQHADSLIVPPSSPIGCRLLRHRFKRVLGCSRRRQAAGGGGSGRRRR